MNAAFVKPAPVPPDSPVPEESTPELVEAERAELHRQGAKAAARGDAADTNPMSRQRNSPEHTGETDDVWQQRHAAWQEGHDAQSDSDPL